MSSVRHVQQIGHDSFSGGRGRDSAGLLAGIITGMAFGADLAFRSTIHADVVDQDIAAKAMAIMITTKRTADMVRQWD